MGVDIDPPWNEQLAISINLLTCITVDLPDISHQSIGDRQVTHKFR